MSGSPFDRPIVILGAPRSGTSFLAHLLASHPTAVGAPEARLAWRFGNDRRSDQLRPQDARPDVIEHIHRYFSSIVREQGGGRLIEKSPSNSVRPWFVDAVLPNARYVHIVRNGWSSVPSMREFWGRRGRGMTSNQRRIARERLREIHPSQLPFYAREVVRRFTGDRHVPLFGPRIPGLQQIADEHGLLEAAAHQWRACVERSAAFGSELDPGRYMEIKLELLDGAKLLELLSFCELEPAEQLLARFESTYDAAQPQRLPDLSESEEKSLAPLIKPTNAFLGYPVGR